MCFAFSGLCPHRHCAAGALGTRILCRNCRNPMQPVRIWVITALSAFCSCECRASRLFAGSWSSSPGFLVLFQRCSHWARTSLLLAGGATCVTGTGLPLFSHSVASFSHLRAHFCRRVAGVEPLVFLLPRRPWVLQVIASQARRISYAWLESSRRLWNLAARLSR